MRNLHRARDFIFMAKADAQTITPLLRRHYGTAISVTFAFLAAAPLARRGTIGRGTASSDYDSISRNFSASPHDFWPAASVSMLMKFSAILAPTRAEARSSPHLRAYGDLALTHDVEFAAHFVELWGL